MGARSNHVQQPFGGLGPVALNTDSSDDQRVAGEVELIVFTNLANGLFNSRVLKFDQALATLADEMFVLRVTIIVIVISVASQFELAKQAGIDQFRECPVHGRPADVPIGRL